MSDKVDFKAKKITGAGKKNTYDKRDNPQRNIAIANVNKPNKNTAKHVKQKQKNWKEKDNFTFRVEDFNTPFSIVEKKNLYSKIAKI